ncbi:MAG: secondary thiamine-phosphate synthase enzyme YjbQ [Thermodesulfobacteriota bacterium]
MAVQTASFSLKTKGNNDIKDITGQVAEQLVASGLKEGIATVFVPGSTAGITTVENESGLLHDLDDMLNRLVPRNIEYRHDRAWGEGNGFSHVRASLIGASFTVPFSEGRLSVGTWQQIVLVDFDNRPRERKIIVKMIGE